MKKIFFFLLLILFFLNSCGEHTTTVDGEKMQVEKKDSIKQIADSTAHK